MRSVFLLYDVLGEKSRRSLGYHQCEALYIIGFEKAVYHQADRNTHLRCDDIQHGFAVLMICSLTVDDIPSLSAWIKKFLFRRTGIFW